MAMWCVSGIVMMYVSYPALDPQARLQALEPLNWDRCCVLPVSAQAETVTAASVEMLAGRPTLSLSQGGRSQLIDLRSGYVIPKVSSRQAALVAQTWVSGNSTKPPKLLGLIQDDQWTVSGDFAADRPLYHFAMEDAAGEEIYVSSTTGRVVQATRARERFWNWLGAVPHWLYFSALRRHASLWSGLVITTSVLGCFLVVVGLYIGVHQLSISAAGQSSPYRGVNLWHHIAGLIFGLFALGWVTSGLLSMNPWGWLEGEGAGEERAHLWGREHTGAEYTAALSAVARAAPTDVASLSLAPLNGQMYFIARSADAEPQRLDAAAAAAPLGDDDVAFLAHALRGGGADPVAELLSQEDEYYFRHHHELAPLPVYRVNLADGSENHYYLDAVSGALVYKADLDAQRYRWLYKALHRMDFSAFIRSRPQWDGLMLLLMTGVTMLCGTGAYLGYRRLLGR